jgi:RNA polymerase sigma-70 factor (ECF subfamily)
VFQRAVDGSFHAHAIQVLSVTASGIARIVAFSDTSLFELFGLPAGRAFAEL